MKLAFVEPHLKLFGGIRRIMELSNRLADRGVEVTIFHSDGSPCSWIEGRAKTRPATEILSEPQDVVIYNDPEPLDFDLVRRAEARVKVYYVLELYETSLLYGFKPQIYLPRHQRTRYIKRSLEAGYKILCNASWMAEFIKERMGLDSTLLFGGVNRTMFHPVERAANPHPRILCSGDPRPRKGTALIEAAVERLKSEFPTLELDRYHGRGIPQEKMFEIYTAADIFVEASWQAGWNNPAAEALACGVPLVCSDIGGVRDFAHHEKTALLFPADDVAALTDSLRRLLHEPALGQRLAAAGVEEIGRFDWDQSADRLLELMEAELR